MEVEGVKANQIEAHCQQHVRRVHRSHRTHRALGNGDAFQAHNQGIGVAALEGSPNEGKVQERQAVANVKEFKRGDLFEVAQ